MGRPEYEIEVVSGIAANSAVEQVTRTVFDVRDRLTQVEKGVSSAASNIETALPTLTTVRAATYDGGNAGGDGYVTGTKDYFGTGTSDYTAMEYVRDFRGRTRGMIALNGTTKLSPYLVQDLDWAGNVVASAAYDTEPSWTGTGGVLETDSFAGATNSAHRRRLTKSYFDDLGRLYRTERYKVNASNGNLGDRFQRDRYYDRNNRVVASATKNGSASEVAYDGAGRQYQSRTVLALNSTLYSSGAFQYVVPAPLPSLAAMQTAGAGNGGVITLSHTELDDSGNPTGQHVLECNHDDNNGLAMVTDGYVRRTVYSWYDGADRPTTTADFGSGDTTSGAGTWKYTGLPPADTEPSASSETKLVTKYAYNADTGRQEIMTDPAGTKTKMFFDDLGRQTFVARNWDDFSLTPSFTGAGDATDKSKDVVTGHVYNGLGQTTAMTVYAVGGENQTTSYLYESTVDAGWVTSEIYPDSADSDSTGTDQVKFEYNVDGSRSKKTDQRGTVIDYTYTNRRQLEFEKVTTLGGSTDGHVRSIKRQYDTDLGRLEKITSYSTTDDTGTIRNQVKLTYNDLDQVTKSEQLHEGAVGMSTPSVQYVYDDTPLDNVFRYQHRLKQTVYPSGRTVFYDFDTTNAGYPANRLSRIQSIRSTDGNGIEWTRYSYAGTDRLVIADYPEIDVKLDYYQGTAAVYAGLDRFARIKDQFWDSYGMAPDVDRFKYGYDYASSRTYRDNTLTTLKDQLYSYDGLHRLKTFDQGTLDLMGASPVITGTPTVEQDWGLDALGNWSSFITKVGGTTNLNQSRTTNKVNEITDISASVGSTWADPVYDAAGNATTVPNPNGLGTAMTLVYDAWNRAIEVKWPAFGNIVLEKYEYDGLGRRIVRTILPASSNDIQHSYYNEDWQELEVRREVSGTESANPLEQLVWHPYYIDALATRFYDSDVSNSTGVVQHYFTHDANFNVTAAVDASAAVVERYEYTPYGKLTFLDPSFANDADGLSDIANSHTYTGRRFDEATGLYHYRYRQYSADLGNFMTRDPIGYDGGDENLYRYVASNPINGGDPSGKMQSGLTKPVCCTFNNGSTIWSQTTYCFPSDTAAKCCLRTGSGLLWSWQVLASSDRPCSPPPPPRDFCDQDWAKLDWGDCVACCVKNLGVNEYAGAGTAGSGVLGWRVPKPHPQPGQYPDQSWLYGPRRCLPKCIRPTLNTVRTVGRWAGRVFIVTGVAEFGVECACAGYCSAE